MIDAGMQPFLVIVPTLKNVKGADWQEIQESHPLDNEDEIHAHLPICQGPSCC